MTTSSPAKPPSAYKAAPRTFVSSAPLCPRCDKSVYAAEQALGPGGREYHKACLTCVSCKKTVQPGGFQEHEGDPYCKHCYAKHHGPKGLGFGGSMTGEYTDPILTRSPFSSPARSSLPSNRKSGTYGGSSDRFVGSSNSPSRNTRGGSPATPNFSSRTSIESPVGLYRTSRLQEMEDASQSSMSVDGVDNDEDDDDYAAGQERNRTLRREDGNGITSRSHAGINASQFDQAPDFDDEPARDTSVSPTKPRPPSSAASSSYRGSPLKHAVPPSAEHHSFVSQMQQRPTSPTSSIGTSAASSSGHTAESGMGGGVRYNSNLGLLQSSGPALCRRCQTPVYHAEQVIASGHKWHKRCLRCAKCSKALDSHLQEKDNLPYCKRCYDDQWGLKSQGFVLRPGLH